MRTPLDRITLIVVIIGALNWLSVGLFRYDLIGSVFGAGSLITRTIFTIVGVAGLYTISLLFRESETVRDH